MDLKNFKKNIGYFTEKLKETTKDVSDNLAKKFSESSFVLKNEDELKEFIKRSKDFVSPETGKVFKKRVLVIVGNSDSDFYKEMLKYFPILFTKSWVANNSIRLIDEKNIDNKKYNISFLPSLIVFQSEEFYKEIPGENNIRKIVFNKTMDIDKLIDEIELEEPKNLEEEERNTSPQSSPLKEEVNSKKEEKSGNKETKKEKKDTKKSSS